MSRIIDDYEYCEQMLSIYRHRQSMAKKVLRKLDSDNYIENLAIKAAVPGNLLALCTKINELATWKPLEIIALEVTSLFTGYVVLDLIEKQIVNKKIEKIDLDQLVIDYYNSIEKEKGIHAQMAMIEEREKPKVYTKKIIADDFSEY